MQALINKAEARYNAAPGLHRVDTHADQAVHTPARRQLPAVTEDQRDAADTPFMVWFGCICAIGVALSLLGVQLLINAAVRGAA